MLAWLGAGGWAPGGRKPYHESVMLMETHRVALPFLLVLALLALPVVAQEGPQPEASEAQVEAAVKEFESYFGDRNEHVRKAAIDGLAPVNHKQVTEILLKRGLVDPSEEVRRASADGLAWQTNKLGLSIMIQVLWKARDSAECMAILRAFASSRPESAFPAIAKLTEHKDWELSAKAAEVIGAYPDTDARGTKVLIPLMDDKAPLVRLAAIDSLVALGNEAAKDVAVAALKDKDWRVQATAIKYLQRIRHKDAIQPLIDLIRTRPGRLQDDATAALTDLTDHDPQGGAEEWQKWWDRVKDRFKVLTLAEREALRKKEVAGRAGYAQAPGDGNPPYHGIKTSSRRMLFVVDISASMADKVTLDYANEAIVKNFEERYGDLRVKIDIAREELINMVAGLKGHTYFNIITFDAEVHPWKDVLVKAGSGNKNSAIKYLSRLKSEVINPTGTGFKTQSFKGRTTNTCGALDAAFGIFKGDEQGKKDYRTDADTVFVLSDGLPTTGDIVEPNRLIEHVAELNLKAKMVIHTIGFGSSNKGLLENLAVMSGGQFVMLGW